MAVERIPIISKNNEYSVEANPDGSGIRFMQKFPNGYNRWAATIIDNGDEFVFAKLLMTGVEIQSFCPTMEMQLKNGKMPPVEVDNQVEANTPYAKKMFARYLYADEKPSGVIIGYSDGSKLWSVALCTEKDDSLLFSFSR